MPSPFPAKLPHKKPDRELSASMERMYDIWNPHEDRGTDRPLFKNNNLRFDEPTYFQRVLKLPEYLQKQILKEQDDTDQNTIGTFKEPS